MLHSVPELLSRNPEEGGPWSEPDGGHTGSVLLHGQSHEQHMIAMLGLLTKHGVTWRLTYADTSEVVVLGVDNPEIVATGIPNHKDSQSREDVGRLVLGRRQTGQAHRG